jgi:ribonuclease HI
MTFLNIYTDGACSGNQSDENFGGFGAILEFGEHRKEIFGGEQNTTNNRMEMMALLRAFEAIKKEKQSIKIFSDSAYLINCFKEKWYENWKRNGWKTTGKKPVENQDLWEALLPYLEKHQIQFYRVKGHINLNSKRLNLEAFYNDFIENNGNGFSSDEFKHIVEMNNLADTLANKGIDDIRGTSD